MDRLPHSSHLAGRHAPRRGRVVPTLPATAMMPRRALAKLDAPLAIGARLRHERELRGMSLEEISRATRIPLASLERVEADRFDDLPGEVFVRGFLRSYARAIGLEPDEILALYGSARRVPQVAPVPVNAGGSHRESRRVGVAIAFVLLLVLCTMALSFVLRPRGRDVPTEVSESSAAAIVDSRA